MKFSYTFLLALAGTAFALPTATKIQQRSLLTEIGDAVLKLEDGLGVTALEDTLDKLLGGSLSKLESVLGLTFAEKLLHLSHEGAPPGILQAVGEGVAMLLKGVGLPEIDKFLDATTGGAITSLEKALGVTDLEKALNLQDGV